MKGNEDTVTVAVWKFFPVIAHHSIRRPMSRKCSRRGQLVCTNPNRFAAVATIFRCQHEFLLRAVVVTLGPAIVTAGLQQHHLFCRQGSFFFWFVEFGPIRMQLVSSVLRDKQSPRRVEGKTLPVAYPRCIACCGRKYLVCFVGVKTPDASAGFKFRAWIVARHLGLPIFRLTRISSG